ncbi:MAG: hypothetical protein PF518_18730 [Spirochaetaceae bacterium]|jgi:hypothetical protein|nr:hypothetical protein [Spirochaetaceae bacterium]
MTIRQLAEVSGCAISTVKRVGKMMFPEVKSIGRGIALDYNRQDSIVIMERLPKKNFIENPNIGQMTQDNIGQVTQATGSSLNQKDFVMIGAIVASVMINMEKRVSNIEDRIEKRSTLLPSPEMEPRQQVSKVINNYCYRSGCSHREARNDLYREFNYHNHCNVQLSSRNRNISVINYIEESGMMEKLLSLSIDMFKEGQLL